MPWIVKLILVGGLLFLVTSCVGLIVDDYGSAARDDQGVRKDGQDIFISANTPSISQGYRPNEVDDPFSNSPPGHHGIDIIGEVGAPVIACAAGIIFDAHYNAFYGHRIVISHGQDEQSRTILSKYFHLQKRLVKKGDAVQRGQQIGHLGRTGLLAGYPHLHFEIQTGNPLMPFTLKSKNPHLYWADGVGIVTCYDKTRQWSDSPFKTSYPVPCRNVPWQ